LYRADSRPTSHGRPESWGVQREFIDSTGKRRRASAAAVAAVIEAMGARERDSSAAPVFARPGGVVPMSAVEIAGETGGALPIRRGRLPDEVAPGYHRLTMADGRRLQLVVSPGRCHLPADVRQWGWAAQLYALRSRRSWGMGDLRDLRRLARWSSRLGAKSVVVNPLHAALPVLPQQASPYYPSSRRFRNPLYICVEEAPAAGRLGDLAHWARAAAELNQLSVIDRDRIFTLKMEALASCHRAFITSAPDRERRQLEAYRRSHGDSLREYARFSVLAERFGVGWRRWPEEFRHPSSAAVRRFTADHVQRVELHEWLQWVLDRQLARAADAGVGLVEDLAVGVDPDGADAWAWQDLLVEGVRIGAPADEFNTRGQDWGMPPFDPHRLRGAAYGPWVETIRAAMAHAAGLRIDHVLGLFRLWWMPAQAAAGDGVYVRYRHQELLDILALESWRAGAFVVGEDLGTSEPLVRQELARRSVMSYRVMWFEKGLPATYPTRSMAAVTTHDLPTVAGLWTGSDLDDQERLGLDPNRAGTSAMRRRLARRLGVSTGAGTAAVIAGVYSRLARAPSLLRVVTLEDACAEPRRPNMPGTTDTWPNWSIPLPKRLEQLERDPLAARIAESMRRG
jgi:4-alpha-glucanotransferase